MTPKALDKAPNLLFLSTPPSISPLLALPLVYELQTVLFYMALKGPAKSFSY